MIISLALSLIAIASGALLTYTWDQDAPLASRLCSGTCIGFGLFCLVCLSVALLIGLLNPDLVEQPPPLATAPNACTVEDALGISRSSCNTRPPTTDQRKTARA